MGGVLAGMNIKLMLAVFDDEDGDDEINGVT